jgi:hypothetical protein
MTDAGSLGDDPCGEKGCPDMAPGEASRVGASTKVGMMNVTRGPLVKTSISTERLSSFRIAETSKQIIFSLSRILLLKARLLVTDDVLSHLEHDHVISENGVLYQESFQLGARCACCDRSSRHGGRSDCAEISVELDRSCRGRGLRLHWASGLLSDVCNGRLKKRA